MTQRITAMIEPHHRAADQMNRKVLVECIAACPDCAQACTACADAPCAESAQKTANTTPGWHEPAGAAKLPAPLL